MATSALFVEAPAKINLFLRVLHRRPDGYHEIETLFQTVSLADDVEVSLRGESSVVPPVELEVAGAELGPDEDNLAFRAATAFRDATGLTPRVHIRLHKRIPAGAGLGGGSSDAAAVLRCLSALTAAHEPRLLHRIAAELGSDVPFFLSPSPIAFGRGRGEELEPLATLPQRDVVLSMPPVHVSTAEAYASLAAARGGGGGSPEATRAVETTPLDWHQVSILAENDFEVVVSEATPEVRRSLEGLRAAGASVALLSGSGASSFGIFDDQETATRAAADLERRLGWPFMHVSTRTQPPVPRSPAERG